MSLKSLFISVSIVCAICLQVLSAQDSRWWEFLPDSTHFVPLRGSYHESRSGIIYNPSKSQVNFKLGNSLHLLKLTLNRDETISFGSDILAYAQFNFLRSFEILVDNVDALWGASAVYRKMADSDVYSFRLRVMHNSSHLVDEHYSPENFRRDLKLSPTNLTQEFAEVTAVYEHNDERYSLRSYLSVASRIKFFPRQLFTRYFATAGCEASLADAPGTFLGKEARYFFVLNTELEGTPRYHVNYNMMLGVKIGDWKGRGILFFLSYYRGNNFYSEYYYDRISDFGIGWMIEIL